MDFATAIGLLVILSISFWISNEVYYRSFGKFRRHAIIITGMIGTPIHETAHLIAAVGFGFRVHRVSFFSPDPGSQTLGYVDFSYRKTLIGRIGVFWVGIAPLVAGVIVSDLILSAAGFRTLTDSDQFLNISAVTQWLTLNFQLQDFQVQHYLAVIVLICVGAHSTPSSADLRCCASGAVITGLTLAVWWQAEQLLIDAGYITDGVILDSMRYLTNGLVQMITLSVLATVFLSIVGLSLSQFKRH